MISAAAFHRAVTFSCARRGLTRRSACLDAGVDPSTLNSARLRESVQRGRLGLPSLPVIAKLEHRLGLGPLGLLVLAEQIEREGV